MQEASSGQAGWEQPSLHNMTGGRRVSNTANMIFFLEHFCGRQVQHAGVATRDPCHQDEHICFAAGSRDPPGRQRNKLLIINYSMLQKHVRGIRWKKGHFVLGGPQAQPGYLVQRPPCTVAPTNSTSHTQINFHIPTDIPSKDTSQSTIFFHGLAAW